MNYLAQGLIGGFNQGFAASTQRQQLDKRLKKDAQEMQLREDVLLMQKDEARKNRVAERQNEIEKNNRFLAGQRADDERRAAEAIERANDPRELVARTKATRELEALNNPPPLTQAEQMRADIERMQLEKAHAALTGKTPAPEPTAKIRQPIGKGGYAEFEAPVSQVQNLARGAAAAGFRSPVARQLADVEKQIAAHESAIAGGDHRTGFMNMGSRRDEIGNLTRERVRLMALDLQAKVKAGVITQEEADAEADRLMIGTP